MVLPSFPSNPTSRATLSDRTNEDEKGQILETSKTFTYLVTSEANRRKESTIPLTVDFNSSTSPLTSTSIFWLRSPFATAVVTLAIPRTCVVKLWAWWSEGMCQRIGYQHFWLIEEGDPLKVHTHCVHIVRQCPPRPKDVLHLCFSSQFAYRQEKKSAHNPNQQHSIHPDYLTSKI
jgi:hypothetical protein